MLSEAQVVAVRNAIEKTYIGTCTITEREKVTKTNKSTGLVDNVVLENQPCRLSFEKISTVNQTDSSAGLIQSVKLFIAPELGIKPGSKITVTQNNVTTAYKCSGEPAMYNTHQEVMLELFREWS